MFHSLLVINFRAYNPVKLLCFSFSQSLLFLHPASPRLVCYISAVFWADVTWEFTVSKSFYATVLLVCLLLTTGDISHTWPYIVINTQTHWPRRSVWYLTCGRTSRFVYVYERHVEDLQNSAKDILIILHILIINNATETQICIKMKARLFLNQYLQSII